jgi:hypothetical protein
MQLHFNAENVNVDGTRPSDHPSSAAHPSTPSLLSSSSSSSPPPSPLSSPVRKNKGMLNDGLVPALFNILGGPIRLLHKSSIDENIDMGHNDKGDCTAQQRSQIRDPPGLMRRLSSLLVMTDESSRTFDMKEPAKTGKIKRRSAPNNASSSKCRSSTGRRGHTRHPSTTAQQTQI